jgi:hypothetical protein
MNATFDSDLICITRSHISLSNGECPEGHHSSCFTWFFGWYNARRESRFTENISMHLLPTIISRKPAELLSDLMATSKFRNFGYSLLIGIINLDFEHCICWRKLI